MTLELLYPLTRHEEVQRILGGYMPRERRTCRLCRRRIRIVERDYQRAGVCHNCAHQIVLWYAEAHGDGWSAMAGVTDGRTSAPRTSKGKLSASKQVSVWRRDGFKCVRCGSTEDLSVDHVIPRSKGGSNDESNLQTLCRPCNSSKGARLVAREGGP